MPLKKTIKNKSLKKEKQKNLDKLIKENREHRVALREVLNKRKKEIRERIEKESKNGTQENIKILQNLYYGLEKLSNNPNDKKLMNQLIVLENQLKGK